MNTYRKIEYRTITQQRTVLVEAVNEDAVYFEDDTEITVLSDWETIATDEGIENVEVAS